ncbi:MAG: hypothetical protein ACI8P9_000787 [Parasphingorhabdus sp.]|jgi:hypothetical protein
MENIYRTFSQRTVEIMTDEFLEKIKTLFDKGDYAGAIRQWGVDTSNSVEFKHAAYANYIPGTNDVIVSTYPKSGTTWMKQIAYQIGFRGQGEYNHIDEVVPWPDMLVPMETAPDIADLTPIKGSPTGLHVIKSHLEAVYVPYTEEAKYICVIRDPKDTLVSVAHFENGFNQLLFGATVPTEEWVKTFQTNEFVYQPWAVITDSWWRLRDRDNVLVYLYEDMRKDGDDCAKNVADFLGIELTSEEMKLVLDKSSFAYMKENDHKFAPPAWDSGYVPMIRSGKSGNSKELLTTDQQQQIDDHCLKTLKALESDFPYEELYIKS